MLTIYEKKRMVAEWNKKYQPGQPVLVNVGRGESIKTTTITRAMMISLNLPVVWCRDISDFVRLFDVKPIEG